MNEEQVVPSCRLSGMSFSLFSAAEIRKLSVKEVTNPQTFDVLMHPTSGGLHDPAFGPADFDEVCETCGMNAIFCPGHMSHIVLPLPVYNPLLFHAMFKLLQGSCTYCHHLYMPRATAYLYQKQMQALNYGLIRIVDELRDIVSDMHNRFGVSISGMFDEVKNSLDKCIDEALSEGNVSEDRASRVKNLSAYRHALLKAFLKNCAFKKQACPHCLKSSQPLRQEQCCKIFFRRVDATTSKKRSKPKAPGKTPKQSRPTAEDGTTEVTEMEGEAPEKDDTANKDDAATEDKQRAYLTPTAVRDHMRLIWVNEQGVLREVFGALNVKDVDNSDSCPTDVFFLEVVPVVPSRFRPIAVLHSRRFENPQTANLSKILSDAASIRDLLADMKQKQLSGTLDDPQQTAIGEKEAPSLMARLQQAWFLMQMRVNASIDSDLDRVNTEKNPGIKQLLEKKDGLFRKHMMGKRVDYACRSVISPDPYISTNEIGVPLVFAKKLTYPQPVTPWNFQQLKQMVINGPNQHPGANYVINPDGTRVILSASNRTQREAIAKQLLTPIPGMNPIAPNKQVCRHLKNGDVMLLNRQPTLHRPSIQAHKVRVLPGEKTLRLHYANCKAYNADFDGDEMNAHFPQNELCRAESYVIASTDFQYLVPKDGSPLAGLIQDHMVSGVKLTMRGRYFTRSDYDQLVFSALTDKLGRVKVLPPSILKPQRLWSGKQVFSTVLLNILPDGKAPLNLHGGTKISNRTWMTSKPRPWLAGGTPLQGDDMSESEVVIHQGELLVGILDKAHYGATAYGLVHSCYELYGGPVAGRLLTGLAKLFTTFLQLHGFTLGVEDILVTPKADLKRRKLMAKASVCGRKVAAQAFMLDETEEEVWLERKLSEAHFSRDPSAMKDLDLSMKAATDKYQNKIARACIPTGLEKSFPHNNLQLMVLSGAKGSTVNCMQISCLLGQIELEGHRPALMLNGKSLPSFLPNDTSPRAGGFIDGRFLTGIRPQEYFFHCMAGREGLVDTAVKTSRSGYLQRCLVKHLEGISVNYDLTVRDSDHSVIQFQYGEDGLDILKTQYLNKSRFSFLIQNEETFVGGDELKERLDKLDTKKAYSMWKKIRKWRRKTGDGEEESDTKTRRAPFIFYSRKQMSRDRKRQPADRVFTPQMDSVATSKLMREMWHQLSDAKKAKYALDGKYTKCPEPVTSRIRPDQHFGAISERLEELISGYLSSNPDQLLWYHHEKPLPGHVTAERFETMMKLRALESLAEPGEGVGMLAAQSIGEPSTQMTLNTFHFAGRGEMNVTLGIPRMREILMVGSANIRTPTMEVCLRDASDAAEKGKLLKLKFNKVHLSQVLEDVEVTETMSIKEQSLRCRLYTLRFNFLPHEMYADEYILTPTHILHSMEHRFLRRLQDAITKQQNDLKAAHLVTMAKVRQTAPPPSDGGEAPGRTAANGDEDDVSDDEQNDGNATDVRSKDRQNQEMEYEGEDEEKEEIGDENGGESDGEDAELGEEGGDENPVEEESPGGGDRASPGGGDRASPEGGDAGSMVVDEATAKRDETTTSMDSKRINYVLSLVKISTSYAYDVDEELWCEVVFKLPLSERKIDMASVIEREAKRMVLYEIPGITRCLLSESHELGQEGVMKLRFEGVNVQEMYNYADILKLNELYTNNIHEMAHTYGIEAACRVIIKEVRDVFAGYGIRVDYHHLSLIADYMTFEGEYKSFSRIGIESNASPLQKMTFETTMQFLKSATIQGACDELKSPSSRLITGRLVTIGTGAFDLVMPAIKR